MFIQALTEFNVPYRPTKLWSFSSGDDLTTYSNNIIQLEYDANIVRNAFKDVYPEYSDDEIEGSYFDYHQKLLGNDNGISEARKNIEEGHEIENAENKRRYDMLQHIADLTANDPDALPSPEVMQKQLDDSQKMLADTFAEPKSNIITNDTKIISSIFDAPKDPSKII